MDDLKRIDWITYEFEAQDKPVDWFWYVGFVAVLSAVISLYLGNFTFAALSIIGGLTLILEGGRPPRKQKYSVSRKGVHIATTTIDMDSINSFAIHDEEEPAHLVLDTNFALYPHIMIPLKNAPIERIHRLLIKYLPEETQELPISEHFARQIGL
ncbi:MAG: hypothetical protein Q8P07_02925 [bacterium]|nr:hypothetical protein [bacterium]